MSEKLFIDDYPFRRNSLHKGEKVYDPVLPLIITHHTVRTLTRAERKYSYDWAVDTCFEGEVVTSKHFLLSRYKVIAESVGDKVLPRTDLPKLRSNTSRTLGSQAISGEIVKAGQLGPMPIPSFIAKIWILSNVPEFKNCAVPVTVSNLLAHHDDEMKRHLLGRNPFLDSDFRLQLNFKVNPGLSLWVPENIITHFNS